MDHDQQSRSKKDQILGRVLLVAGLLLVVGAILVYRYSPQIQPGASAAADATVAPAPPPDIRGTPAAQFELPDLDGKMVRRADFDGKVLLVNFWATWCGPCLIEIPWFIDFQKQYGPQGLQVVAISLDEEGVDVVKPFVDKHGMNELTVLMGEARTPELFGGLLGLPTTFMIDRQGNYYSKHQGLADRDVVEQEIRELLAVPAAGAPAANASPNQPDTSPASNS
jgi:cytochrome c biogenesis protein CcmG/thiol:disulfide interchange protein DsbE